MTLQITAIAIDEDALDGVGSLSGITCSHLTAGDDLLTQASQAPMQVRIADTIAALIWPFDQFCTSRGYSIMSASGHCA